MRAHLLAFVTRLRKAGIRVSVAETIDAMSAVEAAGIARREVLRESLAATLLKDESDRVSYDLAFDEHFPIPPPADGSEGKGRRRGPRSGGSGQRGAAGRGTSDGGGGRGNPPPDAEREPREPAERPSSAARSDGPSSVQQADPRDAATQPASPPTTAAEAVSPTTRAGLDARREAEAGNRRGHEQRPATAPRSAAHDRRDATEEARTPVVRRPFADMDPDQLDAARAAARELGRRFLARVSRRERSTRRGRIDVRRTIRRAVARGGALIDLQRRGRRPGKPDLLVLCDVSGSVARASDLLLTLLAATESAFARIARFVFVDRLVPIDYVDGQIRPEGELDLYGYSDLGNVLAELEASVAPIDRGTVLLVLGDARNNRRPARADVLRRLAPRARAVIWAVPEPRARWNTGDSALASYAPSCDLVLEATSLAGLLAALREAAR